MIRSYRDDRTEAVAGGIAPKGFPADLLRPAIRKLTMIESAVVLDDLRSPPGNRLEALKGDRKGQHSIRINDQWRICFVWTDAGAEQVEIVDYH
ncbi:type II toxin-antitoxin system RelE/ParE family toxin [Ochrobactrum teleogrylli]|uniref:Type II toxin-antitoxin system RelE/ParE family toxin n=1 Tax=Ochrobactrum teleogrylli TaxID=2479765 RepID=A0ABY2Y1Q4_9HYPH|nr:type II toxin-antitoxin system RelE/ParE family toxin [[Ochrobactrum] teleogrylli]TNV13248.1 type II toxin-antitoxin system RelE/ParE family toxin [[Ochrobactrum] teleogrylli]